MKNETVRHPLKPGSGLPSNILWVLRVGSQIRDANCRKLWPSNKHDMVAHKYSLLLLNYYRESNS